MNERVRFVAAMLESEESFVELCERFGISRKHPSWSPRELLVLLRRHHPKIDLPVASTVSEILKRNHLPT